MMGKRGAKTSDGPNKKSAILGKAQGGHVQMTRWLGSDSSSSTSTSSLATMLIDKWSWGLISAPMVQQIAKCAVDDGASHPDVVALSALGKSGTYQQNIYAELIRKLPPPKLSSSLSLIDVWMKKGPFSRHQVSHPILLPHEMFAALFEHYPHVFNNTICGGASNPPSKFWRSMADHPQYQDHPAKLRANHIDKCIPLTLHADGVPIAGVGKSWSKSVDIYSWTSLLSSGSTLTTQFLIYIMYSSLRIKEDGKDMFRTLDKKIAWSLYWLFIGKWPERDENNQEMHYPKKGKELAGGYYATLWGVRGDLEFMYKHFNFPWFTSATPCGICQANTSDKPWTDVRSTAAWKATVHTNAAWKAMHHDCNPIWCVPGMGIQSYIPDAMHVLHLGCYQRVFGSVLHYMTHHHLPGSPEENVQQVWGRILQYYREPFIIDTACMCSTCHTNSCSSTTCNAIVADIAHMCYTSMDRTTTLKSNFEI